MGLKRYVGCPHRVWDMAGPWWMVAPCLASSVGCDPSTLVTVLGQKGPGSMAGRKPGVAAS